MLSFLSLTIVAIFCAGLSSADDENVTYPGTYLIVAPKTIRPGLPYAVSVNILKSSDPVVVNLRIVDDQNKTIVQQWQKDIAEGTPVTIKIDKVPNSLVEGITYKLVAKGDTVSGKHLFEKEQQLDFNKKSQSTFIQTDKAIYKPGSTVHFRIISVSPDLKPYRGIGNVKITDPNRNVIQQYSNLTFDGGVIGKGDKMQLILTEEPPLGDWTITSDVNGFKTEKSFTVDKYVLPKFEVTVKSPPYLLIKDDLVVTVTAKYTYGKGVGGTVSLTASYLYWNNDENRAITKTSELDKNGEAIFRFTNAALRESKLIRDYGYDNIKLVATVTEGLTKIVRNGTADVTTRKDPYKVEVTKSTDSFQPGLDYGVTISVATWEDKPLPENADHSITVSVYTSFPYVPRPPGVTEVTDFNERQNINTQNLKLEKDGTLTYTIKTLANATSLRIEARYGANTSEMTSSQYVEASKSPTKSYMQITTTQTSVKAGEKIKFHVKTTADISKATVQVMTRGYMVYIENIKLTNQQADIVITTNNEMAPKSRLIIYAVRPDNKEIVVGSMDMKVSGLMKNNVSITVDPKRAEPNDTVTFTVKASPKSYVGLLAVDQSVLLLKSGNDITQDMVESDIAQYDTTGYGGGWGGPWFRGGFMERRKRMICWRCGWWGIGGKDAATIFENSGVYVLTDAFLYREPIPPNADMSPRLEFAARPVFKSANNGDGITETHSETNQKQSAVPKIRSKFPESWIWTDIISQEDGKAVYKANVPDTITSWITTAFAMSDEDGLGVAPEPAKLEAFRPFFIRLNVPYSVKRGEKLALQVLIFNYMSEDQTVTVTLDHNENSGFDFVQKPAETKDKKSKDADTRIVKVPGNGGSVSAFFPITPTKVGDLKLLVKAIGQGASDAVENVLIVEAEGYPIYRNQPFVVDLSSNSSWSKSVKFDFPANAIPGSQKASVSFVGDIMGPVLENIDKLIQMPYGCGEQNMLNFVPNIVVTRYLKATKRLTPELEAKTKKYMEAGYQREMTYQRDDFSYSAFGKSDKAGSTWLTGFVCRSFHQAKPYIFIDDEKLSSALKFLKSQQKENGAFTENGEIHHKSMQGGSGGGGPPLTAYVFLALIENDIKNADAQNYLERSLERDTDNAYQLAIVTYALHLAGSSKKDDAFRLLEKQAKEKDGFKYWSQNVSTSDTKEPAYYDRPAPADVEMTSYAVLTYLLRGDTSGAVPLIRWLISKQNEFGGYSSTQDTVMALQALGAYAEKAYDPKIGATLSVKNGDQKKSFDVNPSNAIVQQFYELKNFDKPVELEAKGKGVSFGQVSWHFNLPQLADDQPFVCDKDVKQGTSNEVFLNLCCKYALSGRSNMALLEVNSPSGFVIDNEKLNELTKVHDLQRVELEQGDSKANIYFNSIGADKICMNVTSQRVFAVADQKPAVISLKDYYAPQHQIRFDYSIGSKSLNDVCGSDCWGGEDKGQNKGEEKGKANSSKAPS